MTPAAPVRPRATRFEHMAAFYRGVDELVRVVAPFVREGVAAEEPVLVVESPERIAALVRALGTDAADVTFLDMSQVGRNPARIIPAWRDFVHRHDGAPVRGVGEPVWDGRSAAELAECRLHESLLNVAFDDVDRDFRLLCPYDAETLPEEVLADAQRTHPEVWTDRAEAYAGPAHAVDEFRSALPGPPDGAEEVPFGPEDLTGLRSLVRRLCELARLGPDVVDDLVLASYELASNSIGHGGGRGVLRGWCDARALVLEVHDAGVIDDPLVGRERAAWASEGGRGVWLANQLCDLVQVRSSAEGTTVRVHTWL